MEEIKPDESQESNTPDDLPEIKNFLTDLEAQEKLLLHEKLKLEEDFGQQRAKLKDLYIQKEEEVKLLLKNNLTLEVKNEQNSTVICKMQKEIDDLHSQVAIVQYTAENEIEVERRKCMEEIASVTKILKEELSADELEFDELRKKIKYLEIEKAHYRSLYEQKLEESELKIEESRLSPGRFSSVTKSFAKKVPVLSSSLSSSHDGGSMKVADCSPNSSVSPQGESLEESMKKAQESTTVLKSLVVPLEEEIAALKYKIMEQAAQLRVKDAQDQLSLKTSDMVGFLLRGQPIEYLLKELDIKLQGVQNSLNVEKGTRADLELYAAIINTQKTALTDQVERQKEQLQELRKMYNEERKEHSEFRSLLQKTNSRFIEAQRIHLFQMRNVRSILSIDQLRKLHDIMESSSEEKDIVECSDNLLSFTEDGTVATDLDNNKLQVQAESCNSTIYADSLSEKSGTNTSNKDNVCLNLQSEKLPQLTDDQKRALSGGTDCSTEQFLESPKTSPIPIVVNEDDWLLLQNEISNYQKLICEECQTCVALEASLKMKETELKDGKKRKVTAEKSILNIKIELDRESAYRRQTDLIWRQMCNEYEIKEKSLQIKIDQAVRQHKEIISTSKRGFQLVQEQSNELAKKRSTLNREFIRLQEENDILVGKHSIRAADLQNEIINLPESMEDMQLLLLRYREDVITAKVAKEHLEETLNSKFLFVHEQLESEQRERATMEANLSLAMEELREKTAITVELEEKLLFEKHCLIQMEEKLKAAEQKGIDSVIRSQHFITGLKNQIEEHEQKKEGMETTIADLKARVSALQRDLKTSEVVQRDFVRLSQSLQVHLEKIRQSDKEVRWQHEDDIEDCNRCNQKFNAIGRRKHHCKHCGKIFCSDCITKTVSSGANQRLSKVCDVCHTLLVHDATPFFSTETSHSQD